MKTMINTKELRASLPKLVKQVKKGARFTVLYRSHPAFQIIPVEESAAPLDSFEKDSLYQTPAVGRSSDGKTAADHDAILYRS